MGLPFNLNTNHDAEPVCVTSQHRERASICLQKKQASRSSHFQHSKQDPGNQGFEPKHISSLHLIQKISDPEGLQVF